MTDRAQPTWGDLEVLQHEGRLLFPDSIKRRNKTGAIEEVPICIRVLLPLEQRAARLEARAWAAELKLDTDKDPELFEELDTLCILARAIREPSPPHEQYQLPKWLEGHYERGSLAQVADRLSAYTDMLDPRIDGLDDASFWKTVLRIASTRTPLALTDYAPRLQQSFIISMADQALLSPTLKSFLESCASSTPDSSAPAR